MKHLVELPDDVDQRLESLAAATGVDTAHLIREAVTRYSIQLPASQHMLNPDVLLDLAEAEADSILNLPLVGCFLPVDVQLQHESCLLPDVIEE